MTNDINDLEKNNIDDLAKNSEIIRQKFQMFSEVISKINLIPIVTEPKILSKLLRGIDKPSYGRCSHSRSYYKVGGAGFSRSYTKCTGRET